MIAIYSRNSDFNIFVQKALSSIGIIPVFFRDDSRLELFYNFGVKNFLVFLDEPSRSSVKYICDTILRRFPSSNIAVAVNADSSSPTRFREIEGVNRQIIIPCGENIFKQLLFRYFSFTSSYGVLKFQNTSRSATLLGYPLSLSKTDYAIVRLLACAKENPVTADALSEFLKISSNCLSAHICAINKKAFALTDRKLITHIKCGYMLNPHM